MFTTQIELNPSQIHRSNSQFCFFNRESLQILSGNMTHLKELVSISKQTYEETYPGYFEQDELDSLFCEKVIAQQLNDNSITFLIAKYANQYIGYAKIIIEDNVAVLDKLYCLKQFQRKGYGRQLLKTCLVHADNLGINRMKLYVYDQNIKAINFYTNNGFLLQENKIPYFKPDGTETSDYNYCMECPDINAFLVSGKTAQFLLQ